MVGGLWSGAWEETDKNEMKQAVSHRKPQYALMSHRGNDHTYNHHTYNFAQDVTVVLFSRVITGHIKRKKKKERKMSTHKALPFYKDSTQRLFGV